MIPGCPRAGEARSRARLQHSPAAAEPSPSPRPGQGRPSAVSGLLSEIKTAVSREPFTDHYTIIPGRELGR